MPSGSQRGASTPARKKVPSAFQLWFEEAWAGWLKHVSVLIFGVILFVCYQLNLLNEQLLGLVLSLAVAWGALVIAVVPAREHIKGSGQRTALILVSVLWALVAGYPPIRGIYPGRALATGKVTEDNEITLQAPEGGKEIYVLGRVKGEANASYRVIASWQGGAGVVEGELSRSISRFRGGRRGGGPVTTAVVDHNHQKHYLGRTRGPIKLKVDDMSDQLEKELTIEVRAEPIPPFVLMSLAGVVFLAALVLDRMLDPKGRTTLGISAAISLVFALYLGIEQVQPPRVVSPAMGSFFVALVGGGVGGWIMTWFAKRVLPDVRARKKKS